MSKIARRRKARLKLSVAKQRKNHEAGWSHQHRDCECYNHEACRESLAKYYANTPT